MRPAKRTGRLKPPSVTTGCVAAMARGLEVPGAPDSTAGSVPASPVRNMVRSSSGCTGLESVTTSEFLARTMVATWSSIPGMDARNTAGAKDAMGKVNGSLMPVPVRNTIVPAPATSNGNCAVISVGVTLSRGIGTLLTVRHVSPKSRGAGISRLPAAVTLSSSPWILMSPPGATAVVPSAAFVTAWIRGMVVPSSKVHGRAVKPDADSTMIALRFASGASERVNGRMVWPIWPTVGVFMACASTGASTVRVGRIELKRSRSTRPITPGLVAACEFTRKPNPSRNVMPEEEPLEESSFVMATRERLRTLLSTTKSSSLKAA